jgi:hypothetical protein
MDHEDITEIDDLFQSVRRGPMQHALAQGTNTNFMEKCFIFAMRCNATPPQHFSYVCGKCLGVAGFKYILHNAGSIRDRGETMTLNKNQPYRFKIKPRILSNTYNQQPPPNGFNADGLYNDIQTQMEALYTILYTHCEGKGLREAIFDLITGYKRVYIFALFLSLFPRLTNPSHSFQF